MSRQADRRRETERRKLDEAGERDRRHSRARLSLSAVCNQDCVFCDCRRQRKLSGLTLKQAGRKIMLARERGFDMLVLTGGEPTLHPDFFKLTALVRKLGMQLGLVSNGSTLDDAHVARLLADGLRFAQVSLHADEPELQRAITGVDHYARILDGLKNLDRAGVELVVNTVLTRDNAGRLRAIAKRLADTLNGPQPITWKLTWMHPVGLSAADFAAHVLPLAQARREVAALFTHIDNSPVLRAKLNVVAAGLPLCGLPGFVDRSAELRRDDLAEDAGLLDATFQRKTHAGRIKPAPCERCRFYEECPGVWESYIERAGDGELIAERSPVSNSFGFEPVAHWPDFDVSACPVKAGKTEIAEPARMLLVGEDGGARLYRSDSQDFATETLADVKHELGQIYRDISGRLFHEDFATDMVKLAMHPVCRDCDLRHNCATYHEPVAGNVFLQAEDELQQVIATLSGNVLDVGGGPIRYAAELGAAVAAGRMRYHVVEPDVNQTLLAFLDAHSLRDNLFIGRVEDYQSAPERFDWILVLRSHNHLVDLPRAYRQMAAWLKPGGRLLLVDNTVYGIVRSREVWEQIRKMGGAPNFEHFNNHRSDEAIPFVTGAGLRLLAEHPVGRETANQWWCLFEKPV